MSDYEAGNYDEFMLSEDDEDGSDVSMEEDSGSNGPSNEAFNSAFQRARDWEDEHCFTQARALFRKLAVDITYPTKFRFDCWKHIMLCYMTELQYLQLDRADGFAQDLHDVIVLFFQFITANISALDNVSVIQTFNELMVSLLPNIKRKHLFDQTESLIVSQLELQLHILTQFGKFLHDLALKDSERMLFDIESKILTVEVWINKSQDDIVSTSYLEKLENILQNTPQGSEDLLVGLYKVVLQVYIIRFLQTARVDNHEKFIGNVRNMRAVVSEYLPILENSSAMLELHFCEALVILLELKVAHNSSIIDFDTDSKFVICKEKFLQCLKEVEEVGGQPLPLFYNIVLIGFVLSSLIDSRTKDSHINIFQFEEIKLSNDMALVQNLQNLRKVVLTAQPKQLFKVIQSLPAIHEHLDVLIDKLYSIVQANKLWLQIAPVYSCISFEDLQQELSLHETKAVVTRDELVSIFMKSLLEGNANFFYKFDLAKDFVYFGNEHRPFFSKDSFLVESSRLAQFDYACNLGLFVPHAERTRTTDPATFFANVKKTRDSCHAPGSCNCHYSFSSSSQNIQLGVKYIELAEQVAERIKAKIQPEHVELDRPFEQNLEATFN